MEIKNNIIKHYLKNVMFITGMAYAGKSTLCKMLADKYNLIHCEENYNSDVIFKIINKIDQPSLSYFNTKSSWEEYLNRSPEEYYNWINSNSEELMGFEIAELIKLSHNKKVIVDTNIPIEVLKQIADYSQIAVMLSKEGVATENFFNRDDEEKIFLKNEIQKCTNPEKTMKNFKECIDYGSKIEYEKYIKSDCFIIVRESLVEDKRYDMLDQLSKHFGLE